MHISEFLSNFVLFWLQASVLPLCSRKIDLKGDPANVIRKTLSSLWPTRIQKIILLLISAIFLTLINCYVSDELQFPRTLSTELESFNCIPIITCVVFGVTPSLKYIYIYISIYIYIYIYTYIHTYIYIYIYIQDLNRCFLDII